MLTAGTTQYGFCAQGAALQSVQLQLPTAYRSLCVMGSCALQRRELYKWSAAAAIISAAATGISSPALAFGEPKPTKPLRVCLVNAVNARETAQLLQQDLLEGKRIAEGRGVVKAIVLGLDLKSSLVQGTYYLSGGGRRQEGAQDRARDAVEYLASVVEFDAWDRFKKDYTSSVAINNMTPEKLKFMAQALQAAVRELDAYLLYFGEEDRREARDLYRRYYMPVEQQLLLQQEEEARQQQQRQRQ
eukprot:TRINITY_DN78_c2_g1_i2.p1 TRINITY_DN78_c2_g1~~TRINITY_DN78_c2_g1_i2.p1  ORF type:complete len:266 (-),score=93.87 TRINITY_DN78_c2_g1_i2:492-1226(-)